MNKQRNLYVSELVGLLAILTVITGCNPPGDGTQAEQVAKGLQTIVAQTQDAQLTPTAAASEGAPPVETQTPTATPSLTASSVPTVTPTKIPCDQASYVEDVSIPDGTQMSSGDTFTKTWRLLNSGSCTWTSGYWLIFDNGDAMGGLASVQLTSGTVTPGQTVDISINLVAPNLPGTYRGNYKLRNPSNVVFDIQNSSTGTFWVEIQVVASAGIDGIVWHDLCATPFASNVPAPPGCVIEGGSYNANGILEAGEPGIEGVKVWLGLGDCPSAGLATATTNVDGEYSFSGLNPGSYCVSVEVLPTNENTLIPGGWTYPPPAGGVNKEVTVSVAAAEQKSDVNFGWDYQFLP